MSLTDDRSFTEFVAGGDALVPGALLEQMAMSTLDSIGVAARGGLSSPSARALLIGLSSRDVLGDHAVMAGRIRYRAEYAALVNGALIHCLDFDDTNSRGNCHPSAPVLPVALALSEHQHISGRTFLASLAAGHEVCCRVAAALGPGAYERGFHPTAIAGLYGAIAAGARLLDSSREETERAFGIASSMGSGTMLFLRGNSWNKHLQPGLAAQSAIVALHLASCEYLTTTTPLLGDDGVVSMYSSTPDTAALFDGLGDVWIAGETAIKPYPCCRMTHGAIDAALELRTTAPWVRAREFPLEIELSPAAYRVVGSPDSRASSPRTGTEAQFSVLFQVAVALEHGTSTLETLDLVGAAPIEASMARMSVGIDDTLPIWGARLSCSRPDGAATVVECREPLGEPSRAASWVDIETKVRGLLREFASDELSTELVECLHQLPTSEHLDRLFRVITRLGRLSPEDPARPVLVKSNSAL